MTSDITSKTNTALFGHENAEVSLLRDFAAGTLAHGFIISGPRGIGKATLAYRFARTVLSGEMDPLPSDHPIFRRIAAGSHTDMLVVEPLFDPKKEEFARDINVDQAREIGQFLSLTPGEGAWRVVIVDSADQLNNNAANAILKVLEEPPPQTVLMLISHNPGLLLPTIRSRCRMLKLTPLDKKEFTSVIRHIAPEVEDMSALAQLSAFAPGVALSLHAQGALEMYNQILTLVSRLPELSNLSLHGFATEIGTGTVHANWQIFSRLMLCLLERVSIQATGIGVDVISDEEERVLQKLASLHPAAVWADKWQAALEQFSLAEARHLDYKQVIITFFHSLAGKDKYEIAA